MFDSDESSWSRRKRADAAAEDNDERSEREIETRGGREKESSAQCCETGFGKSRDAGSEQNIDASGRSDGDELETGDGDERDTPDMLDDSGKGDRGVLFENEGGGRGWQHTYPISPKMREQKS